jgi:acetyl esterase/lipase
VSRNLESAQREIALAAIDVVRRSITYKRVGRCAIGADLYRQRAPFERPLIVWIHGGALIGGSRKTLPKYQRDGYVHAGFAILAIDYRLAPETRLPLILGDVMDAYEWAVGEAATELGIDPERVAVVGHSAGGYLALSLGQRGVPRPRAIVSFYGYGDIMGSWYAQPDEFYLRQPRVLETDARSGVGSRVVSYADGEERWRFYRYCRQHGTWVREVAGPELSSDLGALESFCPARNVTPSHPPTLLLHGDQDTDVPLAQSLLMAEVLQRNSVTHEMLTIDGRGHMFDHDAQDPAAVEAFDAVLSFLGKHLS